MPGEHRRIVLARHGRPDRPADVAPPVLGGGIGGGCRQNDRLGLVDGDVAPPRLREAVASAGCVIASDARRAIETASRVGAPAPLRIEPLLREVGFPESIVLPLRLSPDVVVLMARGLQLLRCCRCEEPVPATRARATLAADEMVRHAAEQGTVVAIGHGWFSRFLGRELRRRGWRGPRWSPPAYWSAATYERRVPRCADPNGP
jgi:broad specificity phosphatase PhoE